MIINKSTIGVIMSKVENKKNTVMKSQNITGSIRAINIVCDIHRIHGIKKYVIIDNAVLSYAKVHYPEIYKDHVNEE
jgi:hypothetical protein